MAGVQWICVKINQMEIKEREKEVERFFSMLVYLYEDEIYMRWTQWNSHSLARTRSESMALYNSLHHLIDTLMYEPLQFVISGVTNTLEFWSQRPTMGVDVGILTDTFVKAYIQPMLSEWPWFFNKQTPDTLQPHVHRYVQFGYNHVLERLFRRDRAAFKLITKLLLRSVCFDDAGQVFKEVVTTLIVLLNNMILKHERRAAESKRIWVQPLIPDAESPHMQTFTAGGVARFLVATLNWLEQPNLFARVYMAAPEQHVHWGDQVRNRQQREAQFIR